MTLLLLLCGVAPIAGAAALLWYLIHLWVAARMGAKLQRRDHLTLLAGLALIILGLVGLSTFSRHAANPSATPPSTAP
jgi:hypothetical protein